MKRVYKHILMAILIFSVISVAFISTVNFDSAQNSLAEFHTFSYERIYKNRNGEKVHFFQSGETNFTYLHDKFGNILLEDDGNIVYAKNSDGKPVPSEYAYSDNNIFKHPTMAFSDINFEKNPELQLNYFSDKDTAVVDVEKPLNLSTYKGTITNVVIFIKFKGETTAINSDFFNDIFNDRDTESVADYFYTMSNGSLTVDTIMPQSDSLLYIYEDTNARSYYVENRDTLARQKKEAALLSNAVDSASSFLALNSYDLDIDDDKRLDSVTFMVNGSPSNDWGSLLWPHAWNLYDITNFSAELREKAKLDGIAVGQFAFQFVDSVNLGVLVHEFSHVLGSPDLYHYNSDFAPVDAFDLMHRNLNMPQYMTTYMRDKYISPLPNQIENISTNGYYSLKPVSSAEKSDTLAYKIPTTVPNEFLMVEYRTNKTASYDRTLPAEAGLLVYRITETAKTIDLGNSQSSYQNPSSPDLLYVFRPRVHSTGRETNNAVRLANSRLDLEHALLSPTNSNFSSVGLPLSEEKSDYDFDTIFSSNGKNTGIFIKATAISDEKIDFYVKVNPKDNVENTYFTDKISLGKVSSVNANYTGIDTQLLLKDMNIDKLAQIKIVYKDANGASVAENVSDITQLKQQYRDGTYNFNAPIVFNTKGQIFRDPFFTTVSNPKAKPVSSDLYVVDSDNDEILISSETIDYSVISFDMLILSKTSPIPQISSSYYLTLALDINGKVYVTGDKTDEQWAVQNLDKILKISAGYKHSVFLDSSGIPTSVGSNVYGEGDFSKVTTTIVDVSASYFNTYLLDIFGKVYAVGNDDYDQLKINGLNGVKSIASGQKTVVAIKDNGTLVGYGDNSSGQLNFGTVTNAKAAACGSTFTAVLTENGKVQIFGTLQNSNILEGKTFIKISASNDNLALINEDLTPLVLGNNLFGQLDVSGLMDIVNISCGKFSISYLRKDGYVEYGGSGDDYYKTNSQLPNLNYSDSEYIKIMDFDFSKIDKMIAKETYKINLSFDPTNATYIGIYFTSSNKNVATVSASGEIVALSQGTTEITLYSKSNKTLVKSFLLTVDEKIPLLDVTFGDENMQILNGKSVSLKLLLDPLDANEAFTIAYESSSPSIVLVDSNGVLTAKSFGTAKITANLTLTATGKIFVLMVDVTVVSEIDSIIFKKTPKTNYKYGESLDLDSFELAVLTTNEDVTSSSSKTVTLDMVEGFDRVKLGEQTVYINYLDKRLEIRVVVTNFVVSIKLSNEKPPTSFIAEAQFSVGNGKIAKIMADGSIEKIALTKDMVSGYDSTKIGVQTLTVTITEIQTFTCNYNVEIKDKIVGISLDSNAKTILFGESLYQNELLLLHMYSGDIRYEQLAEKNISDFDSSIVGEREVRITYHDAIGNLDFETFVLITVAPLDGKPKINPNKNKYFFVLGDKLNLEIIYTLNGKDFYLKEKEGSLEGVSESLFYQLSNFDNTSSAMQSVTLNVYAKTYSGNLIVNQIVSSTIFYAHGYAKILSYSIKKPSNIFNYTENVTIENADKIRISITDTNGTRYLTDSETSLFYDRTILNEEQELTINYCDNLYKTTIYIEDKPTKIKDISPKQIYLFDELNFDIYLITQSENELLANYTYLTFSYNNETLGTQKAKVVYHKEDLSFEYIFDLEVLDKEVSIAVHTTIKLTYQFGEAVPLDSSYKVTYLSGKDITINFSYELFSVSKNFDNLAVGQHDIELKSKGLNKTFNYTIIVNNYCTGFAFLADSQFIYQKYDGLKLLISATMANGEKHSISASHLKTDFDSNAVGSFTFYLTYMGYTFEQKFEIVLNAKELIFVTLPSKSSYGYGESLNLNGGNLKITTTDNKISYCKNADLKKYLVNFNPLSVGQQTLEFKIGFITAKFAVTISSNKNLLSVINSPKVILDNKKGTISISEEMSFVELVGNLNYPSYLKIKTTEMNLVGSFGKLTFENLDGLVVMEFTLYLKGDANGDGKVTIDDLAALGKLFVTNKIVGILDINGDKAVTLSDLIAFSLKFNDKPVPPLNDIFRNMVCPIKRED